MVNMTLRLGVQARVYILITTSTVEDRGAFWRRGLGWGGVQDVGLEGGLPLLQGRNERSIQEMVSHEHDTQSARRTNTHTHTHTR